MSLAMTDFSHNLDHAATVTDFPDAALGVPDLLAEWDGRVELLLEHPEQLVQVAAALQPPAGTI